MLGSSPTMTALSLPEQRQKSHTNHQQKRDDHGPHDPLPFRAVGELPGQDARQRLPEQEGDDGENDQDMGEGVGSAFPSASFASAASKGAPALFHAPKPPAICATGLSPMRLDRLRRQRRAPAALAVEHQPLAGREDVLVIRAVRIDPELEHAARCVERAGNRAFARQFTRIAQIDEDDIVATVQRLRLVDGKCATSASASASNAL